MPLSSYRLTIITDNLSAIEMKKTGSFRLRGSLMAKSLMGSYEQAGNGRVFIRDPAVNSRTTLSQRSHFHDHKSDIQRKFTQTLGCFY